jgi:hypothetical protein
MRKAKKSASGGSRGQKVFVGANRWLAPTLKNHFADAGKMVQ